MVPTVFYTGGVWKEHLTFWYSNPGRGKDFSLHKNAQTVSKAHPALKLEGTEALFPGQSGPKREVENIFRSSSEVTNGRNYASACFISLCL